MAFVALLLFATGLRLILGRRFPGCGVLLGERYARDESPSYPVHVIIVLETIFTWLWLVPQAATNIGLDSHRPGPGEMRPGGMQIFTGVHISIGSSSLTRPPTHATTTNHFHPHLRLPPACHVQARSVTNSWW